MKPSSRIMELVGIECCLPRREADDMDYIRAIIQYLDEQAEKNNPQEICNIMIHHDQKCVSRRPCPIHDIHKEPK